MQCCRKSHISSVCVSVCSVAASVMYLVGHYIRKLSWYSAHIQMEVYITSGAPSISSGFRIRGKTGHLETQPWFVRPENIWLNKRGEYCSLCLETYPMRMFAQTNLTFIKLHSVESEWGLREPAASDLSALPPRFARRPSPSCGSEEQNTSFRRSSPSIVW